MFKIFRKRPIAIIGVIIICISSILLLIGLLSHNEAIERWGEDIDPISNMGAIVCMQCLTLIIIIGIIIMVLGLSKRFDNKVKSFIGRKRHCPNCDHPMIWRDIESAWYCSSCKQKH